MQHSFARDIECGMLWEYWKASQRLGDVAHMVERSLCMREKVRTATRLAAAVDGCLNLSLRGQSVGLFLFLPDRSSCRRSLSEVGLAEYGNRQSIRNRSSRRRRALATRDYGSFGFAHVSFRFDSFRRCLFWRRKISRASASLARTHLVTRRHSRPTMQPSVSNPKDKLFEGALLQKHFFCSSTPADDAHGGHDEEKDKISVTFVDKDGEEKQIKVPIGMSMLEAAHENDIELEGACEGSLACSTCHVIVMDMEYYNKLEDPTDEENDMLDLAFGLTETSRLGCQVIARPELDGLRLAIPAATRNFAVDGFVPKPH
ncbi:hypothetical protein BT93_L1336 [Corymbia citriodora subsp. variegata]|uniref:2Fe-2S ferredoxin-type domain-containing protein n=1 Tax=Corymbia citriodora subsp. variegata TaxID=360336 RepID=A0A8T0CN62_CORYI|nr:hypothetical protein BT93_L1336 [Corymbia citriodora subsp. variegata]KAF7849012.1 hypothetical protein BT93_L1336 [Corymbia citriodora subsp. variegata]KAF7849013.1 hypothetical protein BT93_L1336 [Corymbia citriodora subsp. variegata]KAF7849014.1 hypothetical protein BT93_L1336 [Corymbia citriodora subsp. variegata]